MIECLTWRVPCSWHFCGKTDESKQFGLQVKTSRWLNSWATSTSQTACSFVLNDYTALRVLRSLATHTENTVSLESGPPVQFCCAPQCRWCQHRALARVPWRDQLFHRSWLCALLGISTKGTWHEKSGRDFMESFQRTKKTNHTQKKEGYSWQNYTSSTAAAAAAPAVIYHLIVVGSESPVII